MVAVHSRVGGGKRGCGQRKGERKQNRPNSRPGREWEGWRVLQTLPGNQRRVNSNRWEVRH